VLHDGRIRRVGDFKEIDTDVRVVAATNRDLSALIRKGEFREDMYFRLAVIPIRVPPLRERKEDILLLADHFIKMFSREKRRGSVSRRRLSASSANSGPATCGS
jgi:transcriptional regulator with GAF, ATPase, and Fis domain